MFTTKTTYWSNVPVTLIDCCGTAAGGGRRVDVQFNHRTMACPVIKSHGRAFAIVPEFEVKRHAQEEKRATAGR